MKISLYLVSIAPPNRIGLCALLVLVKQTNIYTCHDVVTLGQYFCDLSLLLNYDQTEPVAPQRATGSV